jgi:hypothetical protein
MLLKNTYEYSVNVKLVYKPKELLQEIFKPGFSRVYPNITIALRIFVSLPTSLVSSEHSFDALKHFKNYCRSTVEQDLLNGFATININYNLA